ncbi:MAG TPA: alpha-amylase family glycosyl hydrolase [Acidimicrobiales bacterium]|nr:alpha-amylase family glycosyl hydrolase [Acidimicrobiales bacterium]
MKRSRVWAPDASGVELDRGGVREPMTRNGEWWEAADELGEAERYAFALDGGAPMPDPRSARQPDGVHGASAVAALVPPPPFTPPSLAESIIYELHVGTFTEGGTFNSAIDRLDDLVDLGVTTVEVMPIAAFPGTRGWGYDGVDLFAPHEHYGGPAGFRAFVDACHRRGLAVILDVVYNHLGPDGNYLPAVGPYFTDRYETPWGAAVNLDGRGSAEVRAFIVDNALQWLRDYAVDGLRLDAVHALYDKSPTHILEELADAAHGLDTPKLVVAEHETLEPRLIQEYGLDGQWFDAFHHALHSLLTGEQGGYYKGFGTLDGLVATLAVGDVEPSRLVGFAQNHDQIGNRARGERLCHLVGPEKQRIAAALVLLGPFTPLLFMGEEWAASTPFQYFTDHQNPALADAVRDGRRREFAAFGWKPEDVPDPQAPATFAASVLRWEERAKPAHADMLAFHRDLIALRKANPGPVTVTSPAPNRIEMHRGSLEVGVDLVNNALEVGGSGYGHP